MSDTVPDPDDGMLETEAIDQMIDEPEEPCDDLNIEYLDSTNSNHDDMYVADMEPMPVPEDCRTDAGRDDSEKKSRGVISVNSAAVDIETLCATFSGTALMERLQFIIDHCPTLRRDATIALTKTLKDSSLNVPRYNSLMASLEVLDKEPGVSRLLEMPSGDGSWVDHTQVKASNLLDMFQSEYKKQKDEGVKESTRRAMEELFSHYVAMGNYTEAMRLYGRGMREYCTHFKHIMKMWLDWLEVTVCSGEWSKVDPLVAQAQRSINEAQEAEEVGTKVAANSHRNSAEQMDAHSRANRALIASTQAKIDALAGISRMRGGRYSVAIEKFLKVDVDHFGSPWIVSPSDMAVFATLTALVTFDRTELKKKVLTDSLCRKFLEAEPKLIELLQCFVRSNFGKCLDILGQMKDSFYLNPFISHQVDDLYLLIRQRAMVQYLRPFAIARIEHMAEVFRSTPAQIEDDIVTLIEKDLIRAKIDALEGVVRTLDVDKRVEAFEKIDKLCTELTESADSMIIKALIMQSKMFVGGDGRNKRKEHTTDEVPGFDPRVMKPSGGVHGMFRNLMGGRYNSNNGGGGPSTSGKRRAEPDSSENNDDQYMYEL